MELARRGVHVVLTGRNEERLEQLSRACWEEGGEAETIAGDVADERLLRGAFAGLPEGPIGAVFAAGFARFGDTLSLDDEVWGETIRTNLTALYRGNKVAIEAMLSRGGGRIVNVLSIASRVAFPGSAAYVASKYGALGLTRSLSAEFRSRGIEIIAFMPGSTDTELWDKQDSSPDRERMMWPGDVGRAIVDALLHEGEAYLDEIVLMPPGGVL